MTPGVDVAAADLELGEGCGYSAEAADAGCGSRADAHRPDGTVVVAPLEHGTLQPPAAHEQAAPVCRICLGGAEGEVGPCFALRELSCSCRGDLRIVHPQCAATWFTSRGSGVCEICNAKAWDVTIQATPRTLPYAAEATTACGWSDQRVRHALCSLLCSALMSLAVFGAPALAHASGGRR